jgi:hypothetical protein
MYKTHKNAFVHPSYWLFWILDSYKSYDLHCFRSDRYPNRFTPEISSTWLQRNGYSRGPGKLAFIKNEINCNSLQCIYRSIFDLNKCVQMNLCPELQVGSAQHDRLDEDSSSTKTKELTPDNNDIVVTSDDFKL